MNLKTEVQELKKEVSGLSAERDGYIEELGKRPFEIKTSAEIYDPKNHPKITELIIQKLEDKERIACKVKIKNENLWVLHIGYEDSCNANFDCEEQGQIFVGVLENEPINNNLNFNDLITFQSCDVIEIRNVS